MGRHISIGQLDGAPGLDPFCGTIAADPQRVIKLSEIPRRPIQDQGRHHVCSGHLRLWRFSWSWCRIRSSICIGCRSTGGWRSELLTGLCKSALRISEVLAGRLKPSFQLRYLSVPCSQILRCLSKLGLKIAPLLSRLDLKLRLHLDETLPLRAEVGKIRLGGGLLPAHLLEPLLGLREFCSPGRQLLSSLAHRFAGYCLLTASRLQIAVQIVQFLCASLDNPFACRSFLFTAVRRCSAGGSWSWSSDRRCESAAMLRLSSAARCSLACRLC